MKTKIAIATHKSYHFPVSSIYLPVHAGKISANIDLQIQGDDTGNNISNKNISYNELSVLYWLWKNTKADVKGLMHYRRYIGKIKNKDEFSNILTQENINQLLNKYDVIVTPPKKFYLLNSYNHYVYSQSNMIETHKRDLNVLKSIVNKLHPEYTPYLEMVFKSRSVHMLNMFIMKDHEFEEYCHWLFTILFEMEKVVSRFRTLGAMGEFLLDTYLLKNNYKLVEMPLIELEKISPLIKIRNRIKMMIANEKI